MLYDMLSACLSSSAKMLNIELKDDNVEEITISCASHLIDIFTAIDE